MPPNSDEKTMVSIGDICPLFFDVLKYKYSNEGCFRQLFSVTDKIILQIFSDEAGDSVSVTLKNKLNGTSDAVPMEEYRVNEMVTMHYAELSPEEGVYSVTVNGKESEDFEVCEEEGDNVLIEYSHKDNNSAFDNVFWIGEERQTFRFRVKGGFKPETVEMHVDNEQFTNQKQEIVELYAMPYKTMDFVVGDNNGVPYYVAELINKILCLSNVSINGTLYVREGDSVPEKLETIGKKQQFIYKVTLRQSVNDIAGIGGRKEDAITSSSGIAFVIDRPEDGDILKYKSSVGYFKNENYL